MIYQFLQQKTLGWTIEDNDPDPQDMDEETLLRDLGIEN